MEPGSADIDVAALHQGYLRQARRAGATLVLDCEVTGLERVGQPLGRADDPGPATPARWSSTPPAPGATRWRAWPALARSACGRCAAPRMLVDAPRGLDSAGWPAAIAIDESFYFKPDAGRLLLSPADEEPSAPCDAQPEDLEVAIAVDRFEQRQRRARRQGAGTAGPACACSAPTARRWSASTRSPRASSGSSARAATASRARKASAALTAALACGDAVPADLAAAGVDAEHLARPASDAFFDALPQFPPCTGQADEKPLDPGRPGRRHRPGASPRRACAAAPPDDRADARRRRPRPCPPRPTSSRATGRAGLARRPDAHRAAHGAHAGRGRRHRQGRPGAVREGLRPGRREEAHRRSTRSARCSARARRPSCSRGRP